MSPKDSVRRKIQIFTCFYIRRSIRECQWFYIGFEYFRWFSMEIDAKSAKITRKRSEMCSKIIILALECDSDRAGTARGPCRANLETLQRFGSLILVPTVVHGDLET